MSSMSSQLIGQLGEWLRFGLVGILATLTYLLFSVSTIFFAMPPYQANLIGYIASVSISYFGHAKFSFRSSRSHREQLPRFILVALTTFGLTNLVMYLVTGILDRDPLLAMVFVAVSIPGITWVLSRFWVFREPQESSDL